MNRTPALVLLVSLSLATCSFDLPDPTLIEYRRALAIQTRVLEPPEGPEVDETRAEVRPMETLGLVALVADPEGVVDVDAELDPIWIACERQPGQPSFACLDDALPLTLAGLPACTEGASPCLAGRATELNFTVPPIAPGSSLEFTLIAATAEGEQDSDGCAASLLAGDSDPPNDCIFVVHNVTLGPLPGVEANRNPAVAIEANLLDSEGEVVDSLGVIDGVVSVPAGLELQLIGRPETIQTYELPVIENGEARGTTSVDEAFSGSWFRTGGDFGGAGGGLMAGGGALDDGLETLWSGGGDATLILVVRDGRGGVGWAVVEIEVAD